MLTIERMEEIIGGIDFYLKRFDEFANSLKEVKNTLQQIKQSQDKKHTRELEQLRMELQCIKIELQKRGLPETTEYEQSFQCLKEMLNSDNWPKAVDPKIIIVNDDMAFKRAHAILDLVVGEHLEGNSFLDFGCGEGHVVMQSLTQNPKFALGYDIDMSKCKFDNEHFTSEFDMVALKGPYDIVLMQDVLDHLENTDPVTVLKQIKTVLSKNGKIYIRTHPWCSKHGSHIYTQINKAFAHLVFDESELSRLGGYVNNHTIKIYNAPETYRQWMQEAEYKVNSEIIINKEIDPFFIQTDLFKEKLLPLWNYDEAAMINNLKIEFIEYIIEPIDSSEVI